MKRALNARPLLDHLAASGFDVKGDIEVLLSS